MYKMRWSICLVILLMYTPVLGEFYRYVDKSGNVKFTDDLKQVPVEYLPKVKTYIESRGILVERADVSAAEKGGTTSDSTAELDQIKARLNQKKTERSTLENEGALARKLINALQILLADSRTARENLGTELVNLRKALDDRYTAAVQSDAVRKAIVSELVSLRTQMTELSGTLKAIQTVKKEQDKALADLQLDLTAQQEAVARLKSDRDNMKTELSSVRKQLREQQTTLSDSKKVRENLSTESMNLRKALEDQRLTDARFKTAQETLASKLASTRKQISSFQTAMEAYQKASRLPLRREAKTGRVLVESPDEQTAKAAETEKVILAPLSSAKSLVPDGFSRQTPNFEGIDDFVRSWARAWEGKDVEAYLSHYSGIFRPTSGISLTMWIKQRQKRISKPAFITIGIRTIKKQMTDGSHARVRFSQTYQSDIYTDQVVKTFDLHWMKNRWEIVRETIR